MCLEEIRHNPGFGMLTKVVQAWSMAIELTAQPDPT